MLNTQSRQVILTFEIFLFGDIRGNEVSGLHLITILPSKLDGAYDKRREGKVVYLNEK